jgi:hypothetical protein
MGKIKDTLIDLEETYEDEIPQAMYPLKNDLGLTMVVFYEHREYPVLMIKKDSLIRYYSIDADTLVLKEILFK